MYRLIFVLLCASCALADSTSTVAKFGDYTLSMRVMNFGMTHELTVLRRDKSVWNIAEYFVKVLNSDSLGLPKDLTGDYVQDVIVETYSGGAHCCFAQYVLSLGSQFEILDTIDHAGKWSDRDGDRLWEVTAGDLTLDYWKLPHSDSPTPVVILEASRKGFLPNAELMKADEPTASEVLTMLREARDANEWRDYNVFSDSTFMCASLAVLHRHFVDLIYRGQAKVGLELLETGWPPIVRGREQYTLDLIEALRHSRYWGVVAEMNGGTVFGE